MALWSLAGLALLPIVSCQGIGSWGPTIRLPLIPVAGAMLPNSDNILLWSSFENAMHGLGRDGQGYTQSVIYNVKTGNVSARTITDNEHDMFCPGISQDFDGRTIIGGGATDEKTTIYTANSKPYWTAAQDMQIPRGYQSQTTLSDGRTFTLGGSWSQVTVGGTGGGKHGEIFDGSTWRVLPGCPVEPILTADREGVYRADNHAWIFAWKNASVFHAGPSKAMNWYTTTGNGGVSAAGSRSDDVDRMCGAAVMYDAVAGKILTASGSPSYTDSPGSANAYIITIGDVGRAAAFEKVTSMRYPRALVNSVVMPDGKVLVLGGQSYARIFTDDAPTKIPEMWDPATKGWTNMAEEPEPRTYHATAILLPDATVMSGGGGLCGGCSTNHLTAQIFYPPYLFLSDGVTRAPRPVIRATSVNAVKLGGSFTVSVTPGSGQDLATAKFSLIRLSTVTHSTNTDQRCIPLTASNRNGDTFTVTIPGDAGIALPGHWYLFAMVNGVPSVAKQIKIEPTTLYTIPQGTGPCLYGNPVTGVFTGPDGNKFGYCPGTDFNGGDAQTLTNVADQAACALACSKRQLCQQATYNPGSRQCWLKDAKRTPISSDGNAVSITRIGRCVKHAEPSQILTASNGLRYGYCPGTDFFGSDSQVVENIQNLQGCANACANRATCLTGSYIPSRSTCWLKDSTPRAVVHSSTQNGGIYKLGPCANGGNPTSVLTASNGLKYGVCEGTSFRGQDAQVVSNVANMQGCAQACSGRSSCQTADWVSWEQKCYLKDVKNMAALPTDGGISAIVKL